MDKVVDISKGAGENLKLSIDLDFQKEVERYSPLCCYSAELQAGNATYSERCLCCSPLSLIQESAAMASQRQAGSQDYQPMLWEQ